MALTRFEQVTTDKLGSITLILPIAATVECMPRAALFKNTNHCKTTVHEVEKTKLITDLEVYQFLGPAGLFLC